MALDILTAAQGGTYASLKQSAMYARQVIWKYYSRLWQGYQLTCVLKLRLYKNTSLSLKDWVSPAAQDDCGQL